MSAQVPSRRYPCRFNLHVSQEVSDKYSEAGKAVGLSANELMRLMLEGALSGLPAFVAAYSMVAKDLDPVGAAAFVVSEAHKRVAEFDAVLQGMEADLAAGKDVWTDESREMVRRARQGECEHPPLREWTKAPWGRLACPKCGVKVQAAAALSA